MMSISLLSNSILSKSLSKIVFIEFSGSSSCFSTGSLNIYIFCVVFSTSVTKKFPSSTNSSSSFSSTSLVCSRSSSWFSYYSTNLSATFSQTLFTHFSKDLTPLSLAYLSIKWLLACGVNPQYLFSNRSPSVNFSNPEFLTAFGTKYCSIILSFS